MRSLLKVIKQDAVSKSEQVVVIPDNIPLPVLSVEGETAEQTVTPSQASGMTMYESVMKKAKEDGESLTNRLRQMAHEERENLLNQTRQEAEEIKAAARQEGLELGIEEKKAEVDAVLKELNRTVAEMKIEQERFMEAYAHQLQDFAIDVAAKILERQLTLAPTDMEALVRSAISSVKDTDWMTVKLSGRMPELIQALSHDYGPAHKVDGKQIELLESQLPLGGCIIDTPAGSIDASISVQLENLREHFKRG